MDVTWSTADDRIELVMRLRLNATSNWSIENCSDRPLRTRRWVTNTEIHTIHWQLVTH